MERKKKTKRTRRSKRLFYEKQIVLIHKAMAQTDPATKEYRQLLKMEQRMKQAARQYEFHIDWQMLLDWCRLAADIGKVVGISVVVICLAQWMYSEDEQLKMKNGSVKELMTSMLRTLTMK